MQKALVPEDAVRAAFPDKVQAVKHFRDETTIIVAPEDVPTVLKYLRDTPGLLYNYLSDISAVDYYPENTRPGRFGVSYHIYSMLYNRRLRVKAFVDEDEPVIPSVVTIWPAANWLEREIMDMMGIDFDGNPDKRRLLMPQDWDGHPHRRDYPLGYETIQFSFNVEEILQHKPFAKE
ncbi:MAG: NADH-quinone oxidoreductase subunit C [Phototrophicales bacterium]|nr:MAG: NADH-quinone oxidoreductase subunit C [Phototrophicales bacterium]RMG75824.1 MAG: NADH-quinone oxidoreductase subunit C [Chloroflexota bacterium]